MTRTEQISRAAAALGLAVAVLASCSQSTQPTTPGTQPPTPPDALTPTALVHGMAGGPLFEALGSRVRMTMSDGSQKATDFDMLILDGDGFSPQQLQEDALLHEAVRGGVWILALDVEEAHKRDGVGYLLGGSTPERSVAYFVRLTRSPNGHPTTDHFDLRDDQTEAGITARHILGYLRLRDNVAAQQFAPDKPPTDPPTGALTWTHTFSTPHNINMPAGAGDADFPNTWQFCIPGVTGPGGNGSQTVMWTQSGAIRLYLENDTDNPQGTQQWVAIEQRGEANPNALARNAACVGSDAPQFPNDPDFSGIAVRSEVNWAQTRFDTQATIPSPFYVVSTSPSNQNNSTEVDTSSGFSIGVSINAGAGGPSGSANASYSYQTTTERTITDWQVANNSVLSGSNPVATWMFASANPWDGSNLTPYNGWTWQEIPNQTFFWSNAHWVFNIAEPNELTKEDFSYAASSVWSTPENTVSTDTVFIGGTDSAWYMDAFVYAEQWGKPQKFIINPLQVKEQWGLNVDLGSVVPIPIASINVGTNNIVTEGEPATGTITLAQPAYADAIVNVSSDSQSLTIPNPNVLIKKGETTGTFTVQIANSGGFCGFGAKLQAFFASSLRQEVKINVPNPPPSCPPQVD